MGDMARQVAAGAAASAEMVKGYAAAFASADCDELIFVPTTGGRPGLRDRRGGRLRGRRDLAGQDGHGGRAGRGVPERSLRVLPRLRDVPAHPTYMARPPGPGASQR